MPLAALLFQAPLFRHALMIAALLAAGTIGFAAVGTLFAAMLVRARSRDVLLPILLYPITVPVIIAGVRGTAALLQQPEPDLADGAGVALAAGLFRCGLHYAGALDVRAGDDRLIGVDATLVRRRSPLSSPAMFAYAPIIDRQRAVSSRRWGWCRRFSTSTCRPGS